MGGTGGNNGGTRGGNNNGSNNNGSNNSGGGGAGGGKTVNSPWTASSGDLGSKWLDVIDAFTLSDAEYMEGRININQARRETIMGIPGMTDDIADGIVARKLIDSSGNAKTSSADLQSSTAWILADGLVDQKAIVAMDKFITARGAVYRVQALGHYDGGGTVARIEAVIDSTQKPPAIISRRDLTNLGPGYRSDQLSGPISK
jgi:hypothetical protein